MKSIKIASIFALTLLLSACSSTASSISSTNSTPTSTASSNNSTPSTPSSTVASKDPTASYSQYQNILSKGNSRSYLPSIGEPNILVIPVIFTGFDFTSLDPSLTSNDQAKEIIEDSFFGDREEGEMDSLKTYYEKSSYGQLKIKGTVTDVVTAPRAYNYYSTLNNASLATGPITEIITTALSKYNATYNYDEYDTDNNKVFDSIWLIYSAPTNAKAFWAFVDFASSRTSFDGINIGPFAWASYTFFNNKDYGEKKDTHTLIHETGHLLGLEDYYNNEFTYPAGGLDMMDYSVGDHMALNKYDFGWIEPTVLSSSGTYTLKPLHSDKEAYIIGAPRHNNSPFWEYYIIEYYQPKGLNQRDSEEAYQTGVRMYTENGLRVFKVNQKLKYYSTISSPDSEYINDINNIRNESYILVNSNASSNSYNSDTSIRLVSLVSSDPTYNYTRLATNNDLFQTSDSYDGSSATWEDESSLGFSFSITSMTDESISFSLTFSE